MYTYTSHIICASYKPLPITVGISVKFQKSLICTGDAYSDLSNIIAAIALSEKVCLVGDCGASHFKGPFPSPCGKSQAQLHSFDTKFTLSGKLYPYTLIFERKNDVKERFKATNDLQFMISKLGIEGEIFSPALLIVFTFTYFL